MGEVFIYARDINGKVERHYIEWGRLFEYIRLKDLLVSHGNDEILFVFLNNVCVYSVLAHSPITWEEVVGCFA